MSLRIVIVEDDEEYAAKLASLLAHENHRVLATFGSATVFLEWAMLASRRKRAEWDLVLMDLCVSEMSGLDTARRLKEILPELPVVFFTVFETPASVVQAIRSWTDPSPLQQSSTTRLLSQLRAITVSHPRAERPGAPRRFQVVGLRPAAMVRRPPGDPRKRS
jgi:DNA-binding NarL/FixJ family response regulator